MRRVQCLHNIHILFPCQFLCLVGLFKFAKEDWGPSTVFLQVFLAHCTMLLSAVDPKYWPPFPIFSVCPTVIWLCHLGVGPKTSAEICVQELGAQQFIQAPPPPASFCFSLSYQGKKSFSRFLFQDLLLLQGLLLHSFASLKRQFALPRLKSFFDSGTKIGSWSQPIQSHLCFTISLYWRPCSFS